MRKHLSDACDAIYLLDLGGNVRKGHAGDSNVFDIQVGVSINLFVKKRQHRGEVRNLASEVRESARIFYNGETLEMNKEATFDFLDKCEHVGNVNWDPIQPDARHTWLTEGLREDFETFLPMGSKQAKAAKSEVSGVIFHQFSSGVQTNRDAWVINFNQEALTKNIRRTIKFYNSQVFNWERRENPNDNVDDFVNYDNEQISWSSSLKSQLKGGHTAEFTEPKIRRHLYRPFTKTNLFFDRVLNQRVFVFPRIFPTPDTEVENRVICVNRSREKPFTCLITDCIPEHVMTGGFGSAGQYFPFYIYDEEGVNRRENITDWALAQFKEHYKDERTSPSGIFSIIRMPCYIIPRTASGIK